MSAGVGLRNRHRGPVDFTATQLDLLTAAYATSLDGCGVVITNDAYPDAHRLAEAGWLERRFEDATARWRGSGRRRPTRRSRTATSMRSAEGRQN